MNKARKECKYLKGINELFNGIIMGAKPKKQPSEFGKRAKAHALEKALRERINQFIKEGAKGAICVERWLKGLKDNPELRGRVDVNTAYKIVLSESEKYPKEKRPTIVMTVKEYAQKYRNSPERNRGSARVAFRTWKKSTYDAQWFKRRR